MARTHKYIKRTGTPGHYKYWYKLPSGEIAAAEDLQDTGRQEHAHRLVVGRVHGKHEMSIADIARETGMPYQSINSRLQGLRHRQLARFIAGRSAEHGYSEHHLKEAMHQAVDHPEYQGLIDRIKQELESRSAEGQPSSRGARRRPTTGRAAGDIPETDEPARTRRPRTESAGAQARAAAPTTQSQSDFHAGRVDRRRERDTVHTPPTPAAPAAPEAPRAEQPAPTPAAPQTRRVSGINRELSEQEATEAERLLQELQGSGIDFERQAEQSREKARRAKERARQPEHVIEQPAAPAAPTTAAAAQEQAEQMGLDPDEQRTFVEESVNTAPNSPASQELSQTDPDFARNEREIQGMIETQRGGGNPYLDRAKKLYEKIKGDMKPERAEVCKHMLQAIADVQVGPTGSKNEGSVKNAYNVLRNTNTGLPAWSAAKKEFESGTFHDLSEVLNNEQVSPEMERMKRGFAAKQFARMKPFVRQEWLDRNTGAPPPYPTFGDLKSWQEHGSARPEWASWRTPTGRAGGTQTAIPKEFADSMPRDAGGKILNPPRWMPIHLTPVWIYAAKKMGEATYQHSEVAPAEVQGQQFSFPSQGNLNGYLRNACRRYIQMRGANKLVDIPKSKLAEIGAQHSDLFKGDVYGMDYLLTHKIIDPVGLLPFVKSEIEQAKGTKKSFELVVDANEKPFIPSSVSEKNLRKSLIDKIIELKKCQKATYYLHLR